MSELAIGSKVWKRNDYPIRRGMSRWTEYTITAETSRSWVVGEQTWGQYKIPKGGAIASQWAFSEAQKEQSDYLTDHRHKIATLVGRIDNYLTLKGVADAVNYKPEE